MGTTGVLITGFGGPDCLEAVEPFMRDLMGREPDADLLDRVRKRYLTIGGCSPLNEIAASIANKVAAALAEADTPMPVAVGMRYWRPYIGDALAQLKDSGCERVITVSLSPFESKVAHGACREAVAEAAARLGGIEIIEAPLVSLLQEYVDYFATSVAAALEEIEADEGTVIVFTAHSLPESDDSAEGDYVAGVRQVADQVAELLGLESGTDGVGAPVLEGFSAYGSVSEPRAWFLVYQSKGSRPGTWLSPDISELVEAAGAAAVTGLVVVPIGFLTDHLETLYDLDVDVADIAMRADLDYARAPGPNDDDSIISAIARSVIALT